MCVCVFVLPELTKANRDLEAMKKQAESTNREYDRLMEEHAKLQVMVDSYFGRYWFW